MVEAKEKKKRGDFGDSTNGGSSRFVPTLITSQAIVANLTEILAWDLRRNGASRKRGVRGRVPKLQSRRV